MHTQAHRTHIYISILILSYTYSCTSYHMSLYSGKGTAAAALPSPSLPICKLDITSLLQQGQW